MPKGKLAMGRQWDPGTGTVEYLDAKLPLLGWVILDITLEDYVVPIHHIYSHTIQHSVTIGSLHLWHLWTVYIYFPSHPIKFPCSITVDMDTRIYTLLGRDINYLVER